MISVDVDAGPFRLAPHRVTVPGRVIGYLDRPALTHRCLPTNRRITVLYAPGGFGKTTVLSECCNVLAKQGVPTAWLDLGADDEPAALGAYLAFAFQHAGVDVLERLGSSDASMRDPMRRVTALLEALEADGGTCVLVLDELERVANPMSVALLNQLVRIAPPGLHLGMACRRLPVGLDIATRVFGGDVEILTERDLRFTKPEISRFFDTKLSRRELAAVAADSAGWPIAMRIQRNAGAGHSHRRERVVRDVVDNWVESRLWYDLSDGDHEFLLDVGLFDRLDAELLDEVLAGANLLRRLQNSSGVAGLLEPVHGDAGSVWRLHPLIREHCADWRRRKTPERYRNIHGRIAAVMARRGETVVAMRHASETRDTEQIGRILLDAGGVRLLLRNGPDRLVAANRFVTDEVIAVYPRLGLVRAAAQIVRGQFREARLTMGEAAQDRPVDTTVELGDLGLDRCLTRALLAQHGCYALDSDFRRAVIVELEHIADLPGIEPLVRGIVEYGLCQVRNLKADFDAALDHGGRAKRWLGARSPYLTMIVEYQFGQVAMAQGRVRDAAERYEHGLRVAKQNDLRDPRLTASAEVLLRELNLERNRIADKAESARIPEAFWGGGTQFASYAAACAVAAELTLEMHGPDSALSRIDEMCERAHRAELGGLVRYLEGLRASLLADNGQAGEAERRWCACGLPASHEGCLDLDRQTWREMEGMSTARLRLHLAREQFDEGRRLAQALIGLSAERGLRRTQMRALVLAMALEQAAGNQRAAIGHLTAFLQLFAETDYARSMVRGGEASVRVLKAFLDAVPESPYRAVAEELLVAVRMSEVVSVPTLSDRECEILARLETQTDRQIAAAVGLSHAGVRYHVKRLLAKLQARDRFIAAHRARFLGLLPPQR